MGTRLSSSPELAELRLRTATNQPDTVVPSSRPEGVCFKVHLYTVALVSKTLNKYKFIFPIPSCSYIKCRETYKHSNLISNHWFTYKIGSACGDRNLKHSQPQFHCTGQKVPTKKQICSLSTDCKCYRANLASLMLSVFNRGIKHVFRGLMKWGQNIIKCYRTCFPWRLQ